MFNDETCEDNQNLRTKCFDIEQIKFANNELNLTNTLYSIWKNEYELFDKTRSDLFDFEEHTSQDSNASDSEASIKRLKLSRKK